MSDHEDVNPKHLEVAMRHAKVIQTQKDVDRHNFDSLETLLDFPLTADATAELPKESDMVAVSEMLQLWRPVDFTELIDERRIADKCGYVLCPLPPRKSKSASRHKVVRTGLQYSVVPKDKTEAWCSAQCVRRAAYLKYQLKTDPGWLRLTDDKIDFSFPIGDIDNSKSIAEIKGIKISEMQKKLSPPFRPASTSTPIAKMTTMPTIALNDEGVDEDRPILSSLIVERQHDNPSYDPPELDEHGAHNAIEGFII